MSIYLKELMGGKYVPEFPAWISSKNALPVLFSIIRFFYLVQALKAQSQWIIYLFLRHYSYLLYYLHKRMSFFLMHWIDTNKIKIKYFNVYKNINKMRKNIFF